jgi:hypothetical protein
VDNDRCVAKKDLGDEMADVFRGTTIQPLCKRAEGMGTERAVEARYIYSI